MKASNIGAIHTKSATNLIDIRLRQIAKAVRQGNTSMSGLARQLGVTPALVSQRKRWLMDNEGLIFGSYDVNKFRGRPVTAK